MTIEELEIVIEAQTREFNQQIANVTNQVSNMEKRVNKSIGNIKNIFGRVGKWIAALGIGKAIKDSIITAMDSIESDSMFDTVFGSLANDVWQWSEELQNTLGLNGYAIRENVATLYNMTQSMGLASNEALNLSKDMTLLAEDMASFYNNGESNRNLNGQLLRDRIAVKRKLNCEWPPLLQIEISNLLQAVKDVFFEVTYPDPMDGIVTKTMYVGDRTSPAYFFDEKSQEVKWLGLKMNFIER